jgi:putative hydrolase of the HAD superfamily
VSILKALLEEMGHSGFPDENIRPALQAMYAVTQAHWNIEADTITTLQELKRCGYLLAIISNAGDDDDVQALIDKAGIRSFFEVIVTSAEVGIRKPNPVIFHAVLKRLGTSPQRSVMVGDRLGADVYGAQSAGMRGILINRRADRRANAVYQAQVAPDAVIESLSELPAVLNRMKG